MEKRKMMELLSVVSALYQTGEIKTSRKEEILSLIKANKEAEIQKILFRIRDEGNGIIVRIIDRYFAFCIDLENNKSGGKMYETNI